MGDTMMGPDAVNGAGVATADTFTAGSAAAGHTSVVIWCASHAWSTPVKFVVPTAPSVFASVTCSGAWQ